VIHWKNLFEYFWYIHKRKSREMLQFVCLEEFDINLLGIILKCFLTFKGVKMNVISCECGSNDKFFLAV